MKNICALSRSAAIFSVLILCPSLASADAGSSSSAIQMLPPTIAGSTSSSGCGANSVLSLNMGATTGSAINCTPTIIDSNGDLSAPGFGTFGGNLTTNGNLTVSSPIGTSGATHYAVNVATNGRMASGDLTKGGNGGLWVADSASTASGQFFGSMDAQHVGIWNKPAGVANGAQYWRLAVDSAGNVGIDNQNPQFPLDVAGNANVSGTVTVSGQTASASTISTANNLAAVSCTGAAGTTALEKNSDGSFSCIAVTDIQGVGKTTVPTCSSTQQLYFNGSAFSCVALPTTATPTSDCQGSNVLQWNASTSSYQCVAISSLTGGAGAGSCAAGWYVPMGEIYQAYTPWPSNGPTAWCGGSTLNAPHNGYWSCYYPLYSEVYGYAGPHASDAETYTDADVAFSTKMSGSGLTYGAAIPVGVTSSTEVTDYYRRYYKSGPTVPDLMTNYPFEWQPSPWKYTAGMPSGVTFTFGDKSTTVNAECYNGQLLLNGGETGYGF